jgi:predicted NBD/HSP70 family sugar kinase
MYAGIDIGGTKTFVASLDDNGVITEKIRFETPKKYEDFLEEASAALGQLQIHDFRAGGVGAASTRMDRVHGRALAFSNLPWSNIPLQSDFEHLLSCPVIIENDAKMAALSEAMLVTDKYHKILYITISTGIGVGLVVDHHIDTAFGDGGGRTMLIEHHGKLVSWESFASGSAIVRRYGKLAEDIDDEKAWQTIARDLALGFIELIALVQPEIIVIGGSVGMHFHKYGKFLIRELKKYETPLLPIPPIQGAARPEDAVLYGCYDLAKERFGHVPGAY